MAPKLTPDALLLARSALQKTPLTILIFGRPTSSFAVRKQTNLDRALTEMSALGHWVVEARLRCVRSSSNSRHGRYQQLDICA